MRHGKCHRSSNARPVPAALASESADVADPAFDLDTKGRRTRPGVKVNSHNSLPKG